MIRASTVALLALCAVLAIPARAADPLLMLLLSVAKEMIWAAATRERPATPTPAEPTPPVSPAVNLYPGTTVGSAQVRRLIDEGFVYLSAAQREEVFESLHKSLMDPNNAAVRASMIEHFAQRAIAMRMTQQRLANLSEPEKASLVAQFRKEVAGLPAEEVGQLAELLRREVLPLPRDLNEMLLAELAAR